MNNSRSHRLLGVMVVVFVVVLAMSAISSGENGEILPDNPLGAARTFESRTCIRCHLVDAGHGGYGPDLGRISLSNNMYDLVGRMWNSAPDMIAKMEQIRAEYPLLTPRDLVNLLVYLGVYQNYVINYAQGADINSGRKMFRQKGCASCHSIKPQKNGVSPSLDKFRDTQSPLGLLRSMWLHGSLKRKAGSGIDWKKFRGSEIRDLLAFIAGSRQPVAYLSPGNPRSGKKLFTSFGCAKCHTVGRTGTRTGNAPDLGKLLKDRNVDAYVILEALWNHSPRMWKAFKEQGKRAPQISTDNLADIVAYLFFVNHDRSTGDVQQGEELFESKSCLACHEASEVSGPKMDLLSQMWNHLPEMLENSRDEGMAWPTFSDGEMSSLIEYLVSLEDTN